MNIVDVDITSVVFQETEFPRCTAHDERIAEVVRATAKGGAVITFDPPALVHIDYEPLLGVKITGVCGATR